MANVHGLTIHGLTFYYILIRFFPRSIHEMIKYNKLQVKVVLKTIYISSLYYRLYRIHWRVGVKVWAMHVVDTSVCVCPMQYPTLI